MKGWLKYTLIALGVLALLLFTLIGVLTYKANTFKKSLCVAMPLEIPQIEPSSQGRENLFVLIERQLRTGANQVVLNEKEFSQLLGLSIIEAGKNKDQWKIKPSREEDDVAQEMGKLLDPERMLFDQARCQALIQAGVLTVAVSLPYEKNQGYLNLRLVGTGAVFSGRPSTLKLQSCQVGSLELFEFWPFGNFIRERVNDNLRNVGQKVAGDTREPLYEEASIDGDQLTVKFRPEQREQLLRWLEEEKKH